jgi:redox-sensitive bicupin YhaK (pirin superfamily)
LNAGQAVTHANKGRHAYLFVMSGAATLNGKPLADGDQARVVDEPELKIRADGDAHVMLLDLP